MRCRGRVARGSAGRRALRALALGAWLVAAGGSAARAQDLAIPELPAGDAPADEEPIAAAASSRLRGQEGELGRRLEEIYGNLSGLSDITVEVGTGVVRLSGEAASLEAREQAARIARRHEGVVAVDNRIRVRRGFAERIAPAWQKLLDSAVAFVAFVPLLLAALLVLLVFWALARLAGRWPRLYRRVVRNRFGADLVRQVVQTVLFLAGVVLAFQVVGAGRLASAALGSAGLIGLVLGLAFRDVVENYWASVLLSLRRPFDPGDLLLVDGHEGKVIRLTSRATILMTLDGNHVRIPNAQVYKGVIVNYSRNPQRRLDFTVPIEAETDLRLAQHSGEAALRALPGVLAQPEPWTAVEAFAEGGLVLRYYAWIDQRHTDWRKARSEALRAVKEALEAAGVEGPEPTYRVELRRAPQPVAEAPPRRAAPDLSPDRHLDERIAAERSGEEDLLSSSTGKE